MQFKKKFKRKTNIEFKKNKINKQKQLLSVEL